MESTEQTPSPLNGCESHHSSLASDASSSPLAAAPLRKPGRPAPNSGRKRTPLPSLSRNQSSPSHSAKMSSLFHDAAASIYSTTRPAMTSLNSARPRIPAYSSRHTKFGQSGADFKCVMSNTASQWGRSEREFSSCAPKVQRRNRCLEANSQLPLKSPLATLQSDFAGPAGCPNPSLPIADALDDECYPSDQEQDNEGGIELLQERQTTPPPPRFSKFETPENLNHPKKTFSKLLPSSPPANSSESDSDECHSSHGVRYIMPYSHADAERAQQVSIDTWLEEVLSTDREDSEKAEPADAQGEMTAPPRLCTLPSSFTSRQTISRTSSNKENAPPMLSSSSPKQDLPEFIPCTRPPSRFRPQDHSKSSLNGVTAPKWQTCSLSPGRGPLSAPPKRKKLYSDWKTQSSPQQVTADRDFRIYEEELAGALAKLSPSVVQHRKGRGPQRKRERCASYWDTDIWGEESPACRGKRTDGERLASHTASSDEGNVDAMNRFDLALSGEQLDEVDREDHDTA